MPSLPHRSPHQYGDIFSIPFVAFQIIAAMFGLYVSTLSMYQSSSVSLSLLQLVACALTRSNSPLHRESPPNVEQRTHIPVLIIIGIHHFGFCVYTERSHTAAPIIRPTPISATSAMPRHSQPSVPPTVLDAHDHAHDTSINCSRLPGSRITRLVRTLKQYYCCPSLSTYRHLSRLTVSSSLPISDESTRSRRESTLL